MTETAAANPSLVSYSVIGKSYEGTDIGQVTLSTDGRNSSKPIIFLECGIHAREWVSPSTCIWIFDQVKIDDFQMMEFLQRNFLWKTVGQRLWCRQKCDDFDEQIWLGDRSEYESRMYARVVM